MALSTFCPNCKTALSCGCQKRTASNGTRVCSTCLAGYELNLKKNPASTNTTPGNVQVLFTGSNKNNE